VYIGDAFAQQNTAFNVTSPDGSFTFFANGPIAKTGRFTADGSGNVTNVVVDENRTRCCLRVWIPVAPEP